MFRVTQCSTSGETVVSIHHVACIETIDSPDDEHQVARNM